MATVVTRAPARPPDTAEALALLRALVAEVRGLRADLALEQRQRPALDNASPDLLPALAAAVVERAFSAREVMQHALVDADLRVVLDAAGVRNARQLGKWFRRIEGETIAGLQLTRIGDDRDGIVWRVLRV